MKRFPEWFVSSEQIRLMYMISKNEDITQKYRQRCRLHTDRSNFLKAYKRLEKKRLVCRKLKNVIASKSKTKKSYVYYLTSQGKMFLKKIYEVR
jgi:DNA-binding MarR family transcriptional regulator